MFEMKQMIEWKWTIETIETEHLTWFNTGNQMNVTHIVNAANSAPFEIENVTPPTKISVSCVKFSVCYSLTWQKRGDSNNNTTSWCNRESMTMIIFIHIQSITKNIWVKVGHLSMISDCTPTPCAWLPLFATHELFYHRNWVQDL